MLCIKPNLNLVNCLFVIHSLNLPCRAHPIGAAAVAPMALCVAVMEDWAMMTFCQYCFKRPSSTRIRKMRRQEIRRKHEYVFDLRSDLY